MQRALIVLSADRGLEPVADSLREAGCEVLFCDGHAPGAFTILEALLSEPIDIVLVGDLPSAETRGWVARRVFECNPGASLLMLGGASRERSAEPPSSQIVACDPVPHASNVAMLLQHALAPRELAAEHAPEIEAVVGDSREMVELRRSLEQLSRAPQRALLIRGEAGTGKQTLARALHERTAGGGQFVHVLDRDGVNRLLALDGQNSGGTLYLGEVTDLSSSMQGRILRFLRAAAALGASAPNVRLVASTARNLDRAVREHLLRPDLAYRFSARVLIPPLRERREDIPALCERILARLGRAQTLAAGTLERLQLHDWPGNVRELAGVLDQAAQAAGDKAIAVEHLPLPATHGAVVDYRLPADGVLFDDLEREVIGQALRLASGNQTRAASLLGLTRDQIRYRMAKFGMARESEPRIKVA